MEQRWWRYLRAKNVAEAEAIQRELAHLVEVRPLGRGIATIGAVDADYAGHLTVGAAALFRYDRCDAVVECRTAAEETLFPYLPGFLSFREAPAVLEALTKLSQLPDLLLVDGQGIAHPRRFGIACHIGVLTGIPAIGCAKTHLVGRYSEPGLQKGDWSPLELDGEVVGAVVRTCSGVKPVFVSPGHLVSVADAVRVVLHCCRGCRIPEPLRAADREARAARRRLGAV